MKKTLRIKEVWIHIIVWVCLVSFPVSVSFMEYGEVRFDFFYRLLVTPVLVYINYLVLVPRFLLNNKIWLYILISITVLVSFNLLMTFASPVAPFERFTELVQTSDIRPLKNLPYVITAIISFSFFLLGGILGVTKDFYRREKKNKEKEVQRKETELQFLRAQLNPHFLFNSLNSIYSLVRNKAHEAPEAVITLSELMRYMIYEAKQEEVPLCKEIDYIKNFVALQLLRLSDSENVKLKISGDYSDKKLPPLLLIPFVENAFKYGTDFKGTTHVDIRLRIIGDNLFFMVKNKIGAYKKDDKNSGIGLENIKSRLELLYPENHHLKIESEDSFYNMQLEINLSR
ncbi:sensor histidine kinase [Flagellimonas maritima]|uniref:sensor histidine kinase n=1 Tax=Flagellimonas maritima TaxID=1383885 RepID=UPI0013E0A9DB|nr:histidine kinase [Allomuricauda aurantiaca]